MALLRELPAWYWRAKTAFSVHSPLLYSLCTEVLEDDRWYYAFDAIEEQRERWTSMEGGKQVDGFAGAVPHQKQNQRTLGTELRRSASPPWKGRLLFRLVQWWKPDFILELGTNMGVGTAYLASACRTTPVITIEQSGTALELAGQLWRNLGLENVCPVHGPFSVVLPAQPLNTMGRCLIFLDGDHHPEKVKAILDLLQRSLPRPFLVVLDDIRWSRAMRDGWDVWPKEFREGAWIDLYQGGLWIADTAFREPVNISLIPRRFKPVRLGWI